MRRFYIIFLALLMGFAAWSQESNLMIGAGLFGETGNRARDLFPGAVLRLALLESHPQSKPAIGFSIRLYFVTELK